MDICISAVVCHAQGVCVVGTVLADMKQVYTVSDFQQKSSFACHALCAHVIFRDVNSVTRVNLCDQQTELLVLF